MRGGIQIPDSQGVFIGENVHFDTNNPQNIIIGKRAYITVGCLILTHYKNSMTGGWDHGKVLIGENAFLDAYTVICKPVTIGKNAIVGAGSIVLKDIPDNEVWAGNPVNVPHFTLCG